MSIHRLRSLWESRLRFKYSMTLQNSSGSCSPSFNPSNAVEGLGNHLSTRPNVDINCAPQYKISKRQPEGVFSVCTTGLLEFPSPRPISQTWASQHRTVDSVGGVSDAEGEHARGVRLNVTSFCYNPSELWFYSYIMSLQKLPLPRSSSAMLPRVALVDLFASAALRHRATKRNWSWSW